MRRAICGSGDAFRQQEGRQEEAAHPLTSPLALRHRPCPHPSCPDSRALMCRPGVVLAAATAGVTARRYSTPDAMRAATGPAPRPALASVALHANLASAWPRAKSRPLSIDRARHGQATTRQAAPEEKRPVWSSAWPARLEDITVRSGVRSARCLPRTTRAGVLERRRSSELAVSL